MPEPPQHTTLDGGGSRNPGAAEQVWRSTAQLYGIRHSHPVLASRMALDSDGLLIAQGFPNSTFVGSAYHDGSIETARERAEDPGGAARVRFQISPAGAYSGTGYDLVTMFDCLHDLADPWAPPRFVRSTLASDGTWMIVEPHAGDRVEDNLNPVGRAYYAFSTLFCTPASLSQEVGLALGAQAGEARIRDVVEAVGFARFRRAAEMPFNLVSETRP